MATGYSVQGRAHGLFAAGCAVAAMELHVSAKRLNHRYLAFQYFCISVNRNEAVQWISTVPVNACRPVRYLRCPVGAMSPKPMVV